MKWIKDFVRIFINYKADLAALNGHKTKIAFSDGNWQLKPQNKSISFGWIW